MVLLVSSEVQWRAAGIQAPLSLIECVIDSSVLLPPFLILSSTHVRLVPRFWHPGLFDHSACLYCTAENCRRLQREEETKRRKGEDRERKHSISLFFSLWHLALREWSSLWGIWELNSGVCDWICACISVCVCVCVCVREPGRPCRSLSCWLLKVLQWPETWRFTTSSNNQRMRGQKPRRKERERKRNRGEGSEIKTSFSDGRKKFQKVQEERIH